MSEELPLAPKRAAESATKMVEVVLPNDANPLGFILGGKVMHLIDIAGAIACHRHTRTRLVTAAVDGLQGFGSQARRRETRQQFRPAVGAAFEANKQPLGERGDNVHP